MPKSTVNVTDAVTPLVPAGNWDVIFIKHAGGNDIYVDFIDGGEGLTSANGVKFSAGDPVLTYANSLNPAANAFAAGIAAKCGAGGQSAGVVVQYR